MDERPLAILIVEDDRDISELLRTALEAEGFDVRVASDGRAALQALDDAQPDVLLLDLMLPDVDGLELCARVREQQAPAPYLPVIMLTALDTTAYKQLGFARGADDYVTKPFDLPELLARVRVWGATSRRIRAMQLARERLEAERQTAQDQAIRHMALAIPDAVNQSLSEVYGYAELLANRPGADPAAQELCARIREATDRLVAIIDQLANAARYVTKRYGADIEVLDVKRASEAAGSSGSESR
ncbi:MAG TPA: response regulator [Chloroflexota bacterium]|nr:response regulator [Chloroflexota bacterium]